MKPILSIILFCAMHTFVVSAVPSTSTTKYNKREKDFVYSSYFLINSNVVNTWNMYPVPVRNVLNLQYTGNKPIQGVVSIFISNMSGYIITRKRYCSLSRTIQVPVDNLGRGTYQLRIVINNEAVYDQRFVK